MKKTLIALAAFAATSAFADVTITGSLGMGYSATHHSTLLNPLGSASPSKVGVISNALGLNANGKPAGDSSGLGVDTAEINFKAVEDLGGGYKVSAAMQFDSVTRAGVVGGDSSVSLQTPVGVLALQTARIPDWLSKGPANIGQLSMDGRTNATRGYQDVVAFVTKLAPTTTIALTHGENAQFGATTSGLGLGSGGAGSSLTNAGAFGQQQRNNSVAITYASGPLIANAQYLAYDQTTDGHDLSIKNVIRAQASYDFGVAKVFAGLLNTTLGGGTLQNGVLAVGVPAGSWYFTGSVNNNVLSGTSGYVGPIFATTLYPALGCSPTAGCGANSLDSNLSGYTLSAQYNFSKSTNVIVSYRNWVYNANAADRDSEFEIALTKNF